MSRTLTPNGKRKLLATRVSEPEFAAVAQACGGMPPSEFVRNAVLKAVADAGILVVPALEPVKPKLVRKRAPSRVGADGLLPERRRPAPPRLDRPLGAGIFQEPGGNAVETSIPPAPAIDRTRCVHRGIRHIGSGMGTCPECMHRVEAGGLWAPECDAGTCGHKD